jgi:hypothetical protein
MVDSLQSAVDGTKPLATHRESSPNDPSFTTEATTERPDPTHQTYQTDQTTLDR